MKVLSKLDSLDNIQDGNTRKLITKTTSSGSGNAVTAVSVSGDTITYTKGSTFLTGHQNAFSNVKVGSSTVAADQAGDTLELVAGDNVTLIPDTTNDKVTIAAAFATKLTGTQANPIYLTSLESGQYLIQGYIKIDATHDFAIPVNCAYDTNCIIGYELFTVCKNVSDGAMSVSCNYGNFLYDITGDNPVLLEEQMYANIDDIPTKTSDLTNDSGYITSYNDEKVKQTANTSSNSALRVLFAPNVLDTDYTGNVNKNSNFTYNPSTKALATGGTVDGYKLAAASAKGVDTSIAAASTSTNLPTSQAVAGFVEGKGYTSNTGTITGVSVNGTSVATSGIANITSVPASILSGAIANGVTATTQSAGDNSTKVATTAYVDTAITNLPEPMIFKGSLGTGGTITTLPTASSSNEGYTYKVITAGTYASQSAKVGDTFISDGSSWVLIPSGDEPSGTVTSVTLKATSPIAIDNNAAITTSGTRTLSHANSGVTAGTYKSVTVNATGHVTGGTNPTTLSGYGITDAKISNGVITLGSNTITPLTSEVNSNLLNNTATGSLRTIGCTNDYTVGIYSFAEGRGSRAYGSDSHAEGYNSYSLGSNSHAEGSYSYAKGSGAHAEGFGAKYSGISGTITSIDTTNYQVSVDFGSDLSTIYNSTVGGILSEADNFYNVSNRITNVRKNSSDNYTFTTDSVAN